MSNTDKSPLDKVSSPPTNSFSWTNLFWAPQPQEKPTDRTPITSSQPAQACPFPHKSTNQPSACPFPHRSSDTGDIPIEGDISKCPVSEEARNVWMEAGRKAAEKRSKTLESCSSDNLEASEDDLPGIDNQINGSLSDQREISSIPRTKEDSNWVYPSQKQFYKAMKRKQWDPDERDMKTVVPLHNMVNEVAWTYIKKWERGQGGDKCGGIKLTSFKGNSHKITPRAFVRHYIFGHDLPFDRHDWIIDRCGKRVDYVIDFYSKMPTADSSEDAEPKFYLDVRPKLNTLEGWRLRIAKAFEK